MHPSWQVHAEEPKQYETELFRKVFGQPPKKEQEPDDGGDDEPPDGHAAHLTAEEPDPQEPVRNAAAIAVYLAIIVCLSTLHPHFKLLGRLWHRIPIKQQVKLYADWVLEAVAWIGLLKMGWPWNVLIYPVHITRQELTAARARCRPPTWEGIKYRFWHPFSEAPA